MPFVHDIFYNGQCVLVKKIFLYFYSLYIYELKREFSVISKTKKTEYMDNNLIINIIIPYTIHT